MSSSHRLAGSSRIPRTLAFCQVLVAGSVAACGSDATSEDSTSLASLAIEAPVDIPRAGDCPSRELYFDGRCRRFGFFERFLSPSASLAAVSGPDNINDGDSGVVVVEARGENSFSVLYIEPDKLLPGELRRIGTLYRGDYQIVFERRNTVWQDDSGFLNMLDEERGPQATSFGTKAWRRFAATPGGYEIIDSNGGGISATAMAGEGEGYCDYAAQLAGVIATMWCEGVILGNSIPVAIGAGAVATVVTEDPSIGVQVALEVVGYAANIAFGNCPLLGDVVADLIAAGVCEATPLPTTPFEFVPFLPDTPVPPLVTGGCPAGMTMYTGQVLHCVTTNSVIDGIEEIEVDCNIENVTNACVYI